MKLSIERQRPISKTACFETKVIQTESRIGIGYCVNGWPAPNVDCDLMVGPYEVEMGLETADT